MVIGSTIRCMVASKLPQAELMPRGTRCDYDDYWMSF
jgi:hypothetical protein